mmetsp:Transcript_3755/g.7372  ORF Transcript_3755/g.7372 Transcript_3755/m.7372 type:complete len:508 (-) Transcript_3755:379-1902(-)
MPSVLAGFDDTSSSTIVSDDAQIWKFHPKDRLAVKNNPLCGITLRAWVGLLMNRGGQVEWLRYWPRLLLITVLALLNSLLGLVERVLFEKAIRDTELHGSPVFVLGHPRTGTTLLHGLLALDKDNFATCSTFCSGFPSSFLWFEGIGKILFGNVMDETRPMDNVKLTFDLPQEDELATNLLVLAEGDNGGYSPYMPLFFMKQEAEFRPYYSFSEASESPMVALALKKWTTAFLYLLKKLTLRATRLRRDHRTSATSGGGSSAASLPPRLARPTPPRLVLKSPVHTARVRLLLQLFPKAQFIYMHRHPYEVFASAAHMADTTYWYTYLNTPSDAEVTEFILKQYEVLWSEYESARTLLAPNQLIEVSFNDLCRDPKSVMKDIYTRFGWSGWSSSESKNSEGGPVTTTTTGSAGGSMEAKVEREVEQGIGTCNSGNGKGGGQSSGCGDGKTFMKNVHKPLPAGMRAVIDSRWSDSFDRLGYSKGLRPSTDKNRLFREIFAHHENDKVAQ